MEHSFYNSSFFGILKRKFFVELVLSVFLKNNNLRNILSTLERGDGTAGKLINDDQLYTELLKSSEALESLLTDLKEHPKKYVHFSIFGKKDKSTPKK